MRHRMDDEQEQHEAYYELHRQDMRRAFSVREIRQIVRDEIDDILRKAIRQT